jgi:hypothetical protein
VSAQSENGIAERKIRYLVETTCAILHGSKLAFHYWPYALKHAVLIDNMSTTSWDKSKTPYEKVHGRRPRVENLIALGTLGFAQIPKENRLDKMSSPKSERVLCLGIAEHHIGWVVLSTNNGRVYVSRDVNWIENDNLQTPFRLPFDVPTVPPNILLEPSRVAAESVGDQERTPPNITPRTIEPDLPSPPTRSKAGEETVTDLAQGEVRRSKRNKNSSTFAIRVNAPQLSTALNRNLVLDLLEILSPMKCTYCLLVQSGSRGEPQSDKELASSDQKGEWKLADQ